MLMGCPACPPDFAIASLGFRFTCRADQTDEDIIECRIGSQTCFQFSGSADSNNPTAIHERNAIAEVVDFVHVMRCHYHSSVEPVP